MFSWSFRTSRFWLSVSLASGASMASCSFSWSSSSVSVCSPWLGSKISSTGAVGKEELDPDAPADTAVMAQHKF